ncbi:MAG: hypothetical protein ACREOA_08335, partial [Candidatus Dormibacteria bacterium]
AGDTPTASHQRQASTCVWGTGVTAAQQTTDPGAASAALEVSYDLGPGAKRSAAEAAMQRACGAAPQSVPGVGGAAYYCNGDMAAVTGPKLVEFLTFSITPPPAVASDAAAMNAALAELRS